MPSEKLLLSNLITPMRWLCPVHCILIKEILKTAEKFLRRAIAIIASISMLIMISAKLLVKTNQYSESLPFLENAAKRIQTTRTSLSIVYDLFAP